MKNTRDILIAISIFAFVAFTIIAFVEWLKADYPESILWLAACTTFLLALKNQVNHFY